MICMGSQTSKRETAYPNLQMFCVAVKRFKDSSSNEWNAFIIKSTDFVHIGISPIFVALIGFLQNFGILWSKEVIRTCEHAHVVSEDEVAGFHETLPRPALTFVLGFAVFKKYNNNNEIENENNDNNSDSDSDSDNNNNNNNNNNSNNNNNDNDNDKP